MVKLALSDGLSLMGSVLSGWLHESFSAVTPKRILGKLWVLKKAYRQLAIPRPMFRSQSLEVSFMFIDIKSITSTEALQRGLVFVSMLSLSVTARVTCSLMV